jgi:hypothetical protein
MEIRKLDRDNQSEYGASTQRLMPWPAINAPPRRLRVIAPPAPPLAGITRRGLRGDLRFCGARGRRRALLFWRRAAFMPPGTYHTVINESDTDFQFERLVDAEMTEKFAASTPRNQSVGHLPAGVHAGAAQQPQVGENP